MQEGRGGNSPEQGGRGNTDTHHSTRTKKKRGTLLPLLLLRPQLTSSPKEGFSSSLFSFGVCVVRNRTKKATGEDKS